MVIEEVIISGLVGKVISDCVDISKEKIKEADKKRKIKNQSLEARIYQLILDVINEVICNEYKKQEVVYDIAENILNGFKKRKNSNEEIVKLSFMASQCSIDEQSIELFIYQLYHEISKEANFDIFKEVLLFALNQTAQDNQMQMSLIHEKLDEIHKYFEEENKKIEIIKKSREFENNKKQDYINVWKNVLFLHRHNDARPLTLEDAFIMPDYIEYKSVSEIDFSMNDTLDQVIDKFVNYENTSTMLFMGVPGIGKSSIVSWIANAYKDDDRIIILRFRDWDREELEEGILRAVCDTFKCKRGYLEHKVLVLDGFDEIKALNIRGDLLYNFLNDIKDFDDFKCIITSRNNYIDEEYLQNVFELKKFSLKKAEKFIKIITGEENSKKWKVKSEIEMGVLGIPVILYMAIMSDVNIHENLTKPELYNSVFAEKGGIFDKFAYDGIEYDKGNQILRDPRNIKKYLRFLQDIAFKMFEKNEEVLLGQEYQVPELNFQGKQVNILEFPIKYLFEKTRSNIEFIHKSVYEYFVSEYIYTTVYNACKSRKTDKKEFAGILGNLFVMNNLSKEILEFLKYKIECDSNDMFRKLSDAFELMIRDGMTYHTKKRYKNIMTCEFRVFYNMLEITHVWNVQNLGFNLSIVKYMEEILSRDKFVKMNLEGVNLSTINLMKMNFSEGKLACTNLSHANLEQINLRSANLERANLVKANLIQADLEGANLEKADMKEAVLGRANLIRANLKKADLKKANLSQVDLEEANLEGADMTNVNLMRADLKRTNLKNANLTGANLMYADLKGANLEGANLEKVIITKNQVDYFARQEIELEKMSIYICNMEDLYR